MPLLTVVTVVYNAPTDLEVTIKNVIELKAELNIEYIVVDGGSTDSTVNVLAKYKSVIDTLVVEKDNGIYDAMNKGAGLVKGDWYIYLNAGDTFIPSSIRKAAQKLAEEKFALVCYGGFNQLLESGSVKKYPKEVCPNDLVLANPVCHQATFYRSLYGGAKNDDAYDISYKVIADQVKLFYLLKRNPELVRRLDEVVCNYDTTGVSASNRWLVLRERTRFLFDLIAEKELNWSARWWLKLVKEYSRFGGYTFLNRIGCLMWYRKAKRAAKGWL